MVKRIWKRRRKSSRILRCKTCAMHFPNGGMGQQGAGTGIFQNTVRSTDSADGNIVSKRGNQLRNGRGGLWEAGGNSCDFTALLCALHMYDKYIAQESFCHRAENRMNYMYLWAEKIFTTDFPNIESSGGQRKRKRRCSFYIRARRAGKR